MNSQDLETESLELLKEAQVILASALNSLGGKTTEGEASYLAWGCVHANKIIEGYCTLRSSSRLHASKMLVRPVLETTFAVVAALKKRGFLFQKAYSEYVQEKKLLKEAQGLAEKAATDPQEKAKLSSEYDGLLRDVDNNFDKFCTAYKTVHPGQPMNRTEVTVFDTATAADLGPWYSRYRIYCQFTHGSLQAAAGNMDEATDPSDNLGMVWMTLILLGELKRHTPSQVPDLAPYWKRAQAMMR